MGAFGSLAVELAAKAYLWSVSPTLLVPLDKQHERSLVELATTARITDERLRTIGLNDAVARAAVVSKTEPPVAKGRRDRVIACRNGAMHVGAIRLQRNWRSTVVSTTT